MAQRVHSIVYQSSIRRFLDSSSSTVGRNLKKSLKESGKISEGRNFSILVEFLEKLPVRTEDKILEKCS